MELALIFFLTWYDLETGASNMFSTDTEYVCEAVEDSLQRDPDMVVIDTCTPMELGPTNDENGLDNTDNNTLWW